MYKAAPNTGIAVITKNEVTSMAHVYICKLYKGIERWLTIVVNILIAFNNEDAPLICKVTIKKSTEAPGSIIDSGG